MTKDDIKEIIFNAIKELNETQESKLIINDKTVLFGKDAALDSMGLVSLIVTVERLVDEKYNKAIVLASEKAFSRSSSPFRTVTTLAEYVQELLEEN